MKNKVIVVGSYNTDLSIKTKRIPFPGETVIGGVFSKGCGGKGANQAVAAARAGAMVSFIARIGNDVLGDEGVASLVQENIDTRFIIRDSDNPTGVAFIVVDEDGENSIVVASGANAQLSAKDINTIGDVMSSSAVLLVQLESPLDAVREAITTSHSQGAVVILNPAPAQPLSKDFLKGIDIITPNKVEAEMITGIRINDDESLRSAGKRICELGIENVLITLGSKGIFWANHSEMQMIPAYAVRSIDSTGAGDVFSGSLAAFIADGMSIEEAVRMANAAAAISVTKPGAQSSAPGRNEIERFMGKYSTSNLETLN